MAKQAPDTDWDATQYENKRDFAFKYNIQIFRFYIYYIIIYKKCFKMY